MPQTEKQTMEEYVLQPDGTVTVTVKEIDVDVRTEEELIAEKEEQLLQIYAELQALKTGQQD
jgi:hypothetical protein